jgi:Skp family chaperone for outer membrane proteins
MLMAAVLLVGGTGKAWSAEGELTLGVVDMDRVANEYREMQRLNMEFQDYQREQEQKLQAHHKARMLTDEERQEYVDSRAMGAPTDVVRARLKELEELSSVREKRILDLRKKEEQTEEEQAELAELETLYNQRMDELAQLQADMQASRLEKYEELSQLVADNVDGAVKAVAERQKLTIVVRKESMLYGGSDITDAVLKELNASEVAEGEAEAEE